MAQIIDQRDLITSYRPGDLTASERIVRVYQNELLRSSFLLTGSPDGAILLSRDTFLAFFQQLIRGETFEDPRLGLLRQLARRFLDGPDVQDQDNGDRPAHELAETVSFEGEQQRYRVSDERSRVLERLELAEPPVRLALVLRDFNALEEESVCQALDQTPFTLRQWLHPVRDRLRDAAGVGPDYAVRELLVNAATAAPRPNLWPEVIGPLEDVYAKEDERRQRFTYAAAGFVGLLLVLAGLWLFDVFPFGGGDENQVAIVPTATPTVTPEPTVTPTPIPELSSFAIPQGDLPGQLQMIIGGFQNGEQASETGLFNVDSNIFASLPVEGLARPSPDGRYLVGFGLTGADTLRLTVIDIATAEPVWDTAVPTGIFSYAITHNRLFVVARASNVPAGNDEEAPVILEFDLETGEQLQAWTDLIPSLQTTVSDFFRVVLLASPDGTRLFVGLEEFGSGPTSNIARTLASYSLPDMTFESSSVQTDSTASRQFPTDFSFFNAYVTPDGDYIYNVDQGEDIVQFRSPLLDQDRDLPLPFTHERQNDRDLRWITSNNGRFLYVLSSQRREVVIVDLLSRRVERSFSLAFADGIPGIQESFSFDSILGGGLGDGLALSHDGNFLYIIGMERDDVQAGFVETSTIWTIDTSTWTVVRSLEVPGLALNLVQLNDQLVIMSELQSAAPPLETRPSKLFVVDPLSGAILSEYSGENLPEWSNQFFALSLPGFYRITYARATAIDHIAYGDVEIESTLPRLTVFPADEEIPAGQQFDLAVRALNPVDGQLFEEPLAHVRFDLDSTIVIQLTHADGLAEEVILIANRTGPGMYLASSTLLEPGNWNAEVTITGSNGDSWTYTADDLFEIVPSWEATDGRRYNLHIESDPDEPQVDQPTTITARFVDIDSGVLLPVDEQIIETFPDQIRISFASERQGVASITLRRNAEGIYEGERSFWAEGEWEATVEIRFDNGERVELGANSITVEP